MENKSRCIVLRTVKLGDNKLIADLLSREMGRISVVLPFSGQRRDGGRKGVSRQLFQPLSVIEADIRHTPRQQLAHIREAGLAVVYTSLPFDGVKLSLAFFVAEFLIYATRDMHCDRTLYDFVEQSLVWLDNATNGIANFHLMFTMRMTRFLGFYPDLDNYIPGSLFDLREGCFTLTTPCHRDYLAPDDAERMMTLMRMTAGNEHLFRLSRDERNRIIDCSLRFYRLHVPAFGEMKSLEVLRSL